MRKNFRVLSLITLYVGIAFVYLILIFLQVENVPVYLFLTIGSVAVLSTSTIYTVVQSKSTTPIVKMKDNKSFPKQKSVKKKTSALLEDYFDAMPLIDKYANAMESFEEIESMDDYIFTIFSKEEIAKIDLLGLSKMDKIFFIREMLYFDDSERKQLIEDILKNKDITDEQIKYNPPLNIIGMDDKIRVYIRSLVEPGERTKIIIIETSELIDIIKEQVGILFDYSSEDFLLSTGGIILDETKQIKDYFIDDDDEIALIPSRKK
ncbi:unnamed protein product [marine sediment metagenome]|uniref:Ubiquitin-like domain-containing protein n=1 Tax=marine sediment metagenome TaxID=412755 RepID=X1RM86_9ZZZZ